MPLRGLSPTSFMKTALRYRRLEPLSTLANTKGDAERDSEKPLKITDSQRLRLAATDSEMLKAEPENVKKEVAEDGPAAAPAAAQALRPRFDGRDRSSQQRPLELAQAERRAAERRADVAVVPDG